MSLFSSPPPELFAAAAAAAKTTTSIAQAAEAVVDPADHPPLRGRGLRWVLLHARTPALFPQTWRDRKHPYIDIPVHSPPWIAYGWLWNT